MKSRYHRFVRRLLIAMPLVILVAWLVPPFFSAERYRRRLEAGLQQALRRPVTFGAVSFRLLWRPGFTIHNANFFFGAEFTLPAWTCSAGVALGIAPITPPGPAG